jgi:hypothetical protein
MKTLIQTVAIAVATITFSSCGNPGGSFVGAYESDGEATMVSGGLGQKGKITGTVTFVEGLNSDLILIDSLDCEIPFQANNLGKIATVVEGSTCLKDDSHGTTQSWTYSSGTATQNGTEIKLLLTGEYASQYKDSEVRKTAFTLDMTLQRIGK